MVETKCFVTMIVTLFLLSDLSPGQLVRWVQTDQVSVYWSENWTMFFSETWATRSETLESQ